ncbi:helix-turn-helix transcriptional regulator [Malikia spinosa]|uniref:Helix-turn-helix transcriptional regulator n=1 Tax=Malikia spinosa TaxID=86180 RepID=A0A7C9NCP2_9BURK|nr:helix-turn-helix transcriptional regulator [Malikia spinosa]MYZ53665.1 helix-turn-helix transcriptional regulator [Malikia spinosa]
MARTFQLPFPSVAKQVQELGERIRLARLRRELSTVLFAERMGVSRETLRRLEAGEPNIALGTYMRALRVLGLDKDIDAIARDDVLGRKLQDLAALRAMPRPRGLTSHGSAHARAAKDKRPSGEENGHQA